MAKKKLSNILENGLDQDFEPKETTIMPSLEEEEHSGETPAKTQSLPPPKNTKNVQPFVRERDLANILRKNMVDSLRKPKALVHGKLKKISTTHTAATTGTQIAGNGMKNG